MEVFNIFIENIKNSWTFEKLTESEQKKFYNLFNSTRIREHIKGTEKQKYSFLNDIYFAFLMGLGYDDFNWRASSSDNFPKF